MLIVVSPAKRLDYESPLPAVKATQPRCLDESAELVAEARRLSSRDIAASMKVSANIARLTAERFANWSRPFTERNARPAVYAFKGDTYRGLAIERFAGGELEAAQRRLRILSGLYGVLRPLDLIQPYRLEMGARLETSRGRNLYEFWGGRITDRLCDDMADARAGALLNLASREYFRAVEAKRLPGRVIEPVFRDGKNGRYQVVGLYAKKARGRMAAWVIRNGVREARELKRFREEGYRYHAASSTDSRPVFRRAEA